MKLVVVQASMLCIITISQAGSKLADLETIAKKFELRGPFYFYELESFNFFHK